MATTGDFNMAIDNPRPTRRGSSRATHPRAAARTRTGEPWAPATPTPRAPHDDAPRTGWPTPGCSGPRHDARDEPSRTAPPSTTVSPHLGQHRGKARTTRPGGANSDRRDTPKVGPNQTVVLILLHWSERLPYLHTHPKVGHRRRFRTDGSQGVVEAGGFAVVVEHRSPPSLMQRTQFEFTDGPADPHRATSSRIGMDPPRTPKILLMVLGCPAASR